MIFKNINRQHIISAIKEINVHGVPNSRKATKYLLEYNGRTYPPKYVISLANKYANGFELSPSEFSGGRESNEFLNNLNFEIKSVQITTKKKVVKKIPEKADKKHSIHCSECKNVIFEMLRKIYGFIKIEHKMNIPADIEAYKNTRYYRKLLKIYNELKNSRGNKNFVRSKLLQPCDIYIQNEELIVELDESQHFSPLRKLALLNYPKDLDFGFDINHYIGLCDGIKAKDNNPIYRDEQRAWYDTLRDFYPLMNGGKPTIRIHMGSHQWCKLDVTKNEDIKWFKNYITQSSNNRVIGTKVVDSHIKIGTVCIESQGDYNNESRLQLLFKLIKQLNEKVDILLLPAGYFDAIYSAANSLIPRLEKSIINHLKGIKSNLVVCIGVDGDNGADQLAVTCSKEGILTMGRKFHPTNYESITPAASFCSKEEGYSRILNVKGKRFYTAVCYDSFGIKHNNTINPDVDAILNLVHRFHPKGQDISGDVLFARHGFAGAAKQWDCPVYGAAVFFNREVPNTWPTGVIWSLDKKLSTKQWKYKDNTYSNYDQVRIKDSETAVIKLYDL
ncbi:MAG TPA: hypothetical protein VNR38_21070 [Ureibacillus sp.]|nr:hypothetical protein [Ureibacillus sp.]